MIAIWNVRGIFANLGRYGNLDESESLSSTFCGKTISVSSCGTGSQFIGRRSRCSCDGDLWLALQSPQYLWDVLVKLYSRRFVGAIVDNSREGVPLQGGLYVGIYPKIP